MGPLPFPLALNIGTDIVHIPRITRLLTTRPSNLTRFTRRILTDPEQADFRARFALPPLPSSPSHASKTQPPPVNDVRVSADMARWLAGRFAAKEAARKAAPNGAAAIGWKDVFVRVGTGEAKGRPEVVYTGSTGERDGQGRVGRLSISHDGEYVVATVLAAG